MIAADKLIRVCVSDRKPGTNEYGPPRLWGILPWSNISIVLDHKNARERVASELLAGEVLSLAYDNRQGRCYGLAYHV